MSAYKKRSSLKLGSMFLKRGDPGRGRTVDYYAKDGDQERYDFYVDFTMIFCSLKLEVCC